MKNRKTTKLLLAAAVALSLTACANSGNGASANSEEPANSSRSKTLRIGLEGTFAPYAYHDQNGKLVGFEKEIADAVATELDRTPEFVESPWESLIAGLDNQNYDVVINNLAPTAERKQKYDFTRPYYTSESWAAVAADSEINAQSDLAGKKCAQTASSNYADYVRDSGAEVLPTSGFADSIQLVEQGRADCTANDAITLAYYLERHPDAKLKLLRIESAPGIQSAIMLNKGNDALRDQIDAALQKLKDSGKLDEIVARYIPSNTPTK